MTDFAPPASLTVVFSVLSFAVAAADVLLVRRAAEPDARTRWTVMAAIAAAGWLALHAAIASSGVP